MKKIYLLLLLCAGIAAGLQAQCVVDANNDSLGISPKDTSVPDVIRSVPFDTVAQVYIPATITQGIYTVTIYWANIDSITNFPTSITYNRTPANDTIYGGGRQCFRISGTTLDTAGIYNLVFNGQVRINAPILGDTTLTFQQLASYSALLGPGAPNFNYFLRVANSTGINDMNHQLAAAMQVMPNPNNGQFDIKLNYNGELTGDIRIMDATGRIVYTQPMSSRGLYTQTVNLGNMAKGIYSVQLHTAEGTASKLVSVE